MKVVKKVLALATCFNRKETTIRCIESLDKGNIGIDFDFIIVDDNSSDGTYEQLKNINNVHVVRGNGNLFYSGGMREAIRIAKKCKDNLYDYVLIFNDDVNFFPNSIKKLIEFGSGDEVCVGATCDDGGMLSYGGVVRTSKFRPSFKTVMSGEKKVYCDTFCANCVLIPRKVFENIENIDPVYHHAMGDFDYGFTIKKHGYKIVASDFFVGQCNDNPVTGSWRDTTLSRKERIIKKESPKGLPIKEYFHYLYKNHNIVTAVLYSIVPYVKIVLGK